MKKVIVSMIFIGLMCAACQSADANLRKETARVIGHFTPDQVTISEVDRGSTSIGWKAETPKGTYRCTADDTLRRVRCVN